MALGTMTRIVNGGNAASGPLYADRMTIVLDNSYPTGGYAFLAPYVAKVGQGRTPLGIIMNSTKYRAEYVNASGKLLIRDLTSGLEVGNGVDLSAVTIDITVISN